MADRQTAGRGRLDRTWEAPPGSSLLVSVVLRPKLLPTHVHSTTMATAVAASDACDEVAGFRPLLKWPNDIVVGDRKLGGLLAEAELKGDAVDAVVVGADRIAANGDTANKIGTYQIAVLAKENKVPFYIAAPVSTFDLSIPDGEHIPIEERSAAEVTHLQGVRIAPDVHAAHPAFDVTPARYIAAIFTERGVARAPYNDSLRALARAGQPVATAR